MRAIICAVVLLSLCITLVIANAVTLQDILEKMTDLADKISNLGEKP